MSSHGLRDIALRAIDDTAFYPPAGQNRLRAMIEQRPDWVISRQRAWGVPIAVFVNRETGEILNDNKVNQRIIEAFSQEGADACLPTARHSASLATTTIRSSGNRSATSSMCGSIQGRLMPSVWSSGLISSGLQISISKDPINIAAGSIPHCSNPAARVGVHPMMPC